MSRYMHYLQTDLRRLIKSRRWLVGVLGVAAMLFFSLENGLFQKGFAAGDVLLTYTNAILGAGMIITYSFCAFPFAAVFPEEWDHKYIRYGVIRGNLKTYVLSKVSVIWLSSVAVMVLGTFVFLLVCRTQVPWEAWQGKMEIDFLLAGCYGDVLGHGHVLLYCLLNALHMGLAAAVLSSMAALCSVFVSNTVLTLIFPTLAARVLGGELYSFYATYKRYPSDWKNLVSLLILSVLLSLLSAFGCYVGLRRKI